MADRPEPGPGTGDRAAGAHDTPDSGARPRDRFVDFLRAGSMAVVVLGHWLILVTVWRRGVITDQNVIGRDPGLWLGTWIGQVVPVFFFVGGFANFASYRSSQERGEPLVAFLRRRGERLLRPTAIFLAVWIAIEVGLHLLDIGGGGLLRGVAIGNTVPFGPMWFLGVYLVVVLLSPVTIRLHGRFGLAVPVALVLGTAVVDGLAFGLGRPGLFAFNLLLVWLLPHQLGYFYADGSLRRLPTLAYLAMAAGGLAALAGLTSIGVYGRSLLGNGVRVWTMDAPTLAIDAVTIWLIGLVMLGRERLERWLLRRRPWRAVVAVNAIVMTLFLWHMTAYLLALLALQRVGFAEAVPGTATWWLQRPALEVTAAAVLFVIVKVVGRYEYPAEARERLAMQPRPQPGATA